MVRLGEIFDVQITGEWGNECAANETGTKVLRTTNFTSDGIIDFENVVIRIINKAKVEKKRLHCGDIILEKSGGTEKTPVGRVVFCDESIEDDTYLCNNFTQAMRVNQKVAFPRYVFYFMWYLHYSGRTDLLQNKTTGIRNLQVRSYLKEESPLPPLDEQRRIAAVLDKVSGLIAKRREQLDKLDELVKSRFVEMFGDPKQNPMKWPVVGITEVIGGKVSNGFFAKRDAYCDDGNVQVLGVANIVNRMYSSIDDLPRTNATSMDKEKYGVKYGDMLFCRSSLVAEGIGKASIVPKNTSSNVLFECHVIRLPLNLRKCVPEFMQVLSTTEFFRQQIIAQSKTATMTTIGQDGILKSQIILPPVEQQQKFLHFIEQTNKSKLTIQQSLDKLEVLKKALMQQYFG